MIAERLRRNAFTRNWWAGGLALPDPAYQAVLDLATTNGYVKPSSAVQSIQQTAMVSLKAGSNNFAKHDALWVFANDCGAIAWENDEYDFGRINWIDPSEFLATLNTFPTFPKNLGIEGDGISAKVTTNFIPSTHAQKLSLNNACFWVFLTKDPNVTAGFEMGANSGSNTLGLFISARRPTTNEMTVGINQTANSPTTTGGSVTSVKGKLALFIRTDSTQWSAYLDDELVDTIAGTSTGLPTRGIRLLCRDNNGTLASFSDSRIMAAGFCDGTVNITELTSTLNAMHASLTSGAQENPEVQATVKQSNLATSAPVGERYRWDGLFAKSPVTGNIAYSYFQGPAHHVAGDIEDVFVIISTDDFDTIGTPKIVFEGDEVGDFAYTNPSPGYDSNGRLHVLATKIHTPDALTYTRVGIFGKYSDDDGDTWSAEYEVTGLPIVGQETFSTYCPILEIGTGPHAGTLVCVLYNANGSDTLMMILRSEDNGATWEYWFTFEDNGWGTSALVDNPTETDIIWLDDNNTQALLMTRCNGRSYFRQYLIDFSVATPTTVVHGNVDFGDPYIDPDPPSTSSTHSHPIRGDRFVIEGVDVLAIYYFTRYRGLATTYRNGAWNVVYAKVSDIISNGINGWVESSRIRVVPPHILDDRSGYFCIRHTANDLNALVTYFIQINATTKDIHFGEIGDDHLTWLKGKLGIV